MKQPSSTIVRKVFGKQYAPLLKEHLSFYTGEGLKCKDLDFDYDLRMIAYTVKEEMGWGRLASFPRWVVLDIVSNAIDHVIFGEELRNDAYLVETK